MHFADKFVIVKKSGVTRTKSGNELFAQGRRIPQLAVSHCIDLSTAAGISANYFHCSSRCYASAAIGSDRSIAKTVNSLSYFSHSAVFAPFFTEKQSKKEGRGHGTILPPLNTFLGKTNLRI